MITAVRRYVALLAAFGGLAGASQAAAESCNGLLPREEGTLPTRPVAIDDLVRLRDFGMVGDSLPDRSPFSLSPDGQQVALVLRQADPTTNAYCQGLVIVGVAGGTAPRLIDRGGDFMRYRIPNLRGAIVPSGTADIITPAWSPDGQSIAYRKRIDGKTRVWVIRIDGSQAHAATPPDMDVEAVIWSTDGKSLIYSAWPDLVEKENAIDREGREGWRYDRRILPISGARPFPQQPLAQRYFAIDVVGGTVRLATSSEKALLEPSAKPSWPTGASVVAESSSGARAWTAAEDPALYLSPTRLWVQLPGLPKAVCSFDACREKLIAAWWSRDGRRLWFVRREGWADSTFTFYAWTPGHGAPRKTFSTEDVYSNCQSLGDRLLCDREASRQPRRIVLLDPGTGRARTVFDPNPVFRSLALGAVTRLHWRNAYGTECYGDLVLPPDHRPGQRHPLIIVQYRTKGFLRGAIGDQYPIQAFAARGYAVLSVERVPFWAEAHARPGDRRTFEQYQQENQSDWIDRRNVLSSILAGIDTVAKLGVADPDTVGITGVSEAAMSTWFALNNSDRFKAASVGSCCMDPKTTLVVGGEAWGDDLKKDGYPRYTADGGRYWKPMSLAMNADHVTAPILMQLSDDEFILGLEAYQSLKEHKRAVEMRIFPDEHHFEWQPVHRMAIYRRTLDWFDFWLRGIEDPDPAKHDQYLQWRAMRAEAGCSTATAQAASRCGLAVLH